MSKETRQEVGVAGKILIVVDENQNDVLIWYVVQHTVPNTTILSDFRVDEYHVNFKNFIRYTRLISSNKLVT